MQCNFDAFCCHTRQNMEASFNALCIIYIIFIKIILHKPWLSVSLPTYSLKCPFDRGMLILFVLYVSGEKINCSLSTHTIDVRIQYQNGQSYFAGYYYRRINPIAFHFLLRDDKIWNLKLGSYGIYDVETRTWAHKRPPVNVRSNFCGTYVRTYPGV